MRWWRHNRQPTPLGDEIGEKVKEGVKVEGVSHTGSGQRPKVPKAATRSPDRGGDPVVREPKIRGSVFPLRAKRWGSHVLVPEYFGLTP